MCFCVDVDNEDVQVLAYNRAFVTSAPTEVVARRLQGFASKALPVGEGLRALERSQAEHPLLFALPESDVLVEVSDAEVLARVGNGARAWRGLDVVALHEVVMPAVFPEGIEQMVFSSDADLVFSLVRNRGRSVGVILRGLAPAQVIEVALEGARMPQKASYFWPKAVTGMVFRSLETSL
jgi:hypothetical protein